MVGRVPVEEREEVTEINRRKGNNTRTNRKHLQKRVSHEAARQNVRSTGFPLRRQLVGFKLSNMVYSSLVQFFSLLALSQAVFVSNLDLACLKCICAASTGCDKSYECSPQGFCGPFFISRKYWEEADKITLNADSRYREDGHEACAKNFNCASKIVSSYMAKNGRDCNNDGITDCDDFARIHFYGEARCENAIENTSYHDRYLACMPPRLGEDKFQKK